MNKPRPYSNGVTMAIRDFIPSKNKPLVQFTAQGEPASKANRRRLVAIRGRTRFIKSKKALDFVRYFSHQCPRFDPLLEGDLIIAIEIFYASRRPDLDESIILDAMQGLIYKNDRQVKERHVYWALDKENPRARIKIWALAENPLTGKTP